MPDALPFYIYQPQPLLIVISGPSGVGKDTVLHGMTARDLPFHFVITTTTRPVREGEQDGVDYFFVGKAEFERMIEQDDLLEYALVYGDYKGVPRRQVREAMQSGKDVVMRIDVQGAASIRKLCPEAVLIFLTVGDEQDLIHRLRSRKSEPEDKMLKRIETARQEMQCLDQFDYVVENKENEAHKTVDVIEAIIKAEHHRVEPRKVTL